MIAEHTLLILLTNGIYAPVVHSISYAIASLSTASLYGQRIDLAVNIKTPTGASYEFTYAPKYQADLLALLNEWIDAYPTEAAPDYEAQKAELERNRISFGVA